MRPGPWALQCNIFAFTLAASRWKPAPRLLVATSQPGHQVAPMHLVTLPDLFWADTVQCARARDLDRMHL